MPGSEAATKYKSFLFGAYNAQKELGLKFTDDAGQLLGAADILDKIRKKYGKLDAAEQNKMLKGFGRKEAMLFITTMIDKTGQLRKDTAEIQAASGMGLPTKMAKSMLDDYDQLVGSSKNLMLSISQLAYQAFIPAAHWALEVVKGFNKFITTYPNIAKALLLLSLAAVGSGVAFGAFRIAVGLTQLGLSPFGSALKGAMWVLKGFGRAAVFAALKMAPLAVEMLAVSWPIILAVAGLAALTYGFYKLEGKTHIFSKAWAYMTDLVGKFSWAGMGDNISAGLAKAVGLIGKLIRGMGKLKEYGGAVWDSVASVFTSEPTPTPTGSSPAEIRKKAQEKATQSRQEQGKNGGRTTVNHYQIHTRSKSGRQLLNELQAAGG